MLLGKYKVHDIGHWRSPSVLRGGWHRGLAARGWQSRRVAGPDACPVRCCHALVDGRPGQSDARSPSWIGLALCLHEALLGLDRQVFGRPCLRAPSVGEHRFWVMDPALSTVTESVGGPSMTCRSISGPVKLWSALTACPRCAV